jgi:hypothetical protein
LIEAWDICTDKISIKKCILESSFIHEFHSENIKVSQTSIIFQKFPIFRKVYEKIQRSRKVFPNFLANFLFFPKIWKVSKFNEKFTKSFKKFPINMEVKVLKSFFMNWNCLIFTTKIWICKIFLPFWICVQ